MFVCIYNKHVHIFPYQLFHLNFLIFLWSFLLLFHIFSMVGSLIKQFFFAVGKINLRKKIKPLELDTANCIQLLLPRPDVSLSQQLRICQMYVKSL